MTRDHRPVVAVDLDDVCADRLGVIATMLREEGVAVPSQRPSPWDLHDWGVRDNADRDQLHYRAFVERDGYRSMAPVPGALEVLTELHQRGARIRIATGRLWTSQVIAQAVAHTGYWLAKHRVPAEDIAFVTDKTAVDADIYVDDAPHFLDDLQKAGRTVIAYDLPYNRSFPGRRARTWSEVLRHIQSVITLDEPPVHAEAPTPATKDAER